MQYKTIPSQYGNLKWVLALHFYSTIKSEVVGKSDVYWIYIFNIAVIVNNVEYEMIFNFAFFTVQKSREC